MPDYAAEQPKRVLIVDPSADSRSVFRTVLERRGLCILEAPEAQQGLDILRQQRPEVVVLDGDSAGAEDPSMRAAYAHELTSRGAELVILGNVRRRDLGADPHLVGKPYHYGPLIRKIEALIKQSADPGA